MIDVKTLALAEPRDMLASKITSIIYDHSRSRPHYTENDPLYYKALACNYNNTFVVSRSTDESPIGKVFGSGVENVLKSIK
jgi:hypothetical protein